MEITSWNSLLSNVWLRLAGLVFLSAFFFTSWPSCHSLLLNDIILGSEPCAKSSDELEIGSGPCLVTFDLWNTVVKTCPRFTSFSFPRHDGRTKCLYDLRETMKGVGQNNKPFFCFQKPLSGALWHLHLALISWVVSAKLMKVSVKAAHLRHGLKLCQVGHTFSPFRLAHSSMFVKEVSLTRLSQSEYSGHEAGGFLPLKDVCVKLVKIVSSTEANKCKVSQKLI